MSDDEIHNGGDTVTPVSFSEDDLSIPNVSGKSEVGTPQQSRDENTPRETTKDDAFIEVENKEAKIWAYLGVMGGVGVTSLAVQTAYELASDADKTVCLIDLNFERGACAAYLDMPPSMTIEELNASDSNMDKTLAAAFIKKYAPNLSIISAQNTLGGNDKISQDALLSLLDTISQMFDFIILDIAPMWRPWTQAAISAADKFALVTELTVPGLHSAYDLSTQISEAIGSKHTPDVILSKFERRRLKHGLILKDAQTVLKRTDLGQICVDDETLLSVVNGGIPAGKIKPNSRYVLSVRTHVGKWLGEVEMLEIKSKRMFRRKTRRA